MSVRLNTSAIAGSSSTVTRALARLSGSSYGAALRWSARLLVAASWISGAVFATYIIAFFGGVILAEAGDRWNESLPDLYDGGALFSTAAIGAHFMFGSWTSIPKTAVPLTLEGTSMRPIVLLPI